MRRTALYSRSPRARPADAQGNDAPAHRIAESAAPAGIPAPPAPSPPRSLRERLSALVARGWMSLLGTAALVALLTLGLQALLRPATAPPTQNDIDAAVKYSLENQPPAPSAAATAYDGIRPSVVLVGGVRAGVTPAAGKRDGDAGKPTLTGVGTGVVFSADGMIFTNLHVVTGSDSIGVVFADGTESEVELIDAQPENDLAVLKAKTLPDDLRPATRELAVKAIEVLIFGAAFLLLMSIMGIDLTAVAVFGGALGVGIGLGLQQIAANFISGIILLIEGQTTVGDYVQLDGGEAGTIVKMTSRACVLETFDGKWIVVPNEHFITTRVVNYSDQGSANRYEVLFSVAYETDINRVPELIEAAVGALPFVLRAPDGPDCELRGFGESAVDFAVEYWVNGIDDGKNKYASKVLFAIWNVLKAEGIEIPYPRRVVEMRNV